MDGSGDTVDSGTGRGTPLDGLRARAVAELLHETWLADLGANDAPGQAPSR